MSRREASVLVALVLLALVLRVVFVLQLEANPNHQTPILDSAYHVSWARAIAAGETFEPQAGRPFFRAPLYPYFLAGIFALFGESLLVARLVQAVLGSASVALVYLLGRRAFDARVGAIAAAIAAIYWVLIYFDGELLIPVLSTPLHLVALWALVGVADARRRGGAAPRRGRAALAGGALGLAALARPNVLLFVPFALLWLLRRAAPRATRPWGAAAAFAAALLAPILPVTAYNAIVGGDLVLISSQAGVNFWIGNNPHANGLDAIVPGTRGGWWEGFQDSVALAEQAEGRALSASEVSRHYAERAWRFVLGEPERSLPLLGRKLVYFWSGWEYGNNESIAFFAERYSWVPSLSPGFALLAPLGLVGVAVSRRRAAALFPLWGFGLAYMASVVAFFVCARFRVPVLPVLMVFAGAALVWAAERVRARAWRPLAAALAFVVVFGLWSRAQAPPAALLESIGSVQLGTAELLRGDPAAAAALFEHALERTPRDVDTRVLLASARLAQGDTDGAVAALERALEQAPRNAKALELLLVTLVDAGRIDAAERRIRSQRLRLARLRVAQMPEALDYHLGRIRRARGDAEGARRAFAAALAGDPHSIRAALALGELAHEGGRLDEAVAFYRRASEAARPLAGSERDDAVHRGLIGALRELGRDAEACDEATAWAARRSARSAARAARDEACSAPAQTPAQG